jgi:hypothetical protein
MSIFEIFTTFLHTQMFEKRQGIKGTENEKDFFGKIKTIKDRTSGSNIFLMLFFY